MARLASVSFDPTKLFSSFDFIVPVVPAVLHFGHENFSLDATDSF